MEFPTVTLSLKKFLGKYKRQYNDDFSILHDYEFVFGINCNHNIKHVLMNKYGDLFSYYNRETEKPCFEREVFQKIYEIREKSPKQMVNFLVVGNNPDLFYYMLRSHDENVDIALMVDERQFLLFDSYSIRKSILAIVGHPEHLEMAIEEILFVSLLYGNDYCPMTINTCEYLHDFELICHNYHDEVHYPYNGKEIGIPRIPLFFQNEFNIKFFSDIVRKFDTLTTNVQDVENLMNHYLNYFRATCPSNTTNNLIPYQKPIQNRIQRTISISLRSINYLFTKCYSNSMIFAHWKPGEKEEPHNSRIFQRFLENLEKS